MNTDVAEACGLLYAFASGNLPLRRLRTEEGGRTGTKIKEKRLKVDFTESSNIFTCGYDKI